MVLDGHTLAVLLAWASILQAVALGVQVSFSRDREALRWWALGAAFTSAGFVFNALRDVSGLGAFATFLNTPILLTGAGLNYVGALRFFRRPVPWTWLGLALALFLPLIAWFTFVQDALLVRRLLLFSYAAVLSLLTATCFWEGQRVSLRGSSRFLAGVFLGYGLYLLIRALSVLDPSGTRLPAGGQTLVYLVALTCGLLWSFGFILLTNQKLAADVQSNAAFLSDVVENSGALIFAKDLEGRYELVNKKWEQVTGIPREKALGRTDQAVFPDDTGQVFREFDARVLEKGELVEQEVPFPDATGVRWFLSLKFPLRSPDGSMRGLCGISTEITERKAQERLAQDLVKQLAVERDFARTNALIDPLTRLANRRQFDDILSTEFFRLKRSGAPLSLILLDVDHFKRFNDRYGHVEGDACLRRVGMAIRSIVGRASDVAARIGGEEFAVVLPETESTGARTMAERIRRAVEELDIPHVENTAMPRVTVSLGVVTRYPSDLPAPESLMELADKALYLAKQTGRNRVEVAARHADDAHPGSGLVCLAWKPVAESGNDIVDSEHRALFTRANELLSALVEGRPRAECRLLLDAILATVVQHFKDEEALIRQTAFPYLDHHVRCHADLVAKAVALSDRYDRDELPLGDLFSFLAYEVIAQHLFHEDRKFFPYL